MTTSTFSFEIKSQLAKLLATENITIRHNPNARTAHFNVDTRELVLPVWHNISEDLYDMLVVHEVGHALDTPGDAWMKAINDIAGKHYDSPSDKNKMAVKGFLNVIEDARIDKRQKRRYPGSKRNYVNGYKELYERDFFGIAKKDVNQLTFIDRINIYFKNGSSFNIKFTEEEREFIRRIDNAETFDDVINITSDIFGYSIMKKDTKKEKNKTDIDEDMFDDLINQTIYDSDIDGDDDDDDDLEIGYDEDQSDDTDGFDDTDHTDDIVQNGQGHVSSDEEETDDENISEKNQTSDVDVPETEKAAEEATYSIIINSDTDYVYLNTPKMNHSVIFDDYKTVFSEREAEYKKICNDNSDSVLSIYNNNLLSFTRNENDTISFMVKEFEMKKSADAYSRTTVSKTGVLDMDKIHTYNYNDDIFRKMSIVPNGKNHGFFMILDWSGSMLTNINDTVKQIISLVLFCKKVQIPFEVYTFRTHEDRYDSKDCLTDRNNSDIHFDNFKMRNILSSRMNITTLNEAIKLLWINSYIRFNCDPMNSTPLNQAILASDVLINEFRTRNKLQVVNTIIVTDGGSDPIRVPYSVLNKNTSTNSIIKKRLYYIRDTVTKKVYHVGQDTYGHKTTEVFLKILKERTQCNLIGFFLTSSFRTVSSILSLDKEYSYNLNKQFVTDMYVGIENAGYDEYYCLNIRDVNKTNDLEINSNMTKKTILKQFMKYSGRKTTNRVMLSKFMNRVTKAA